MERGYSEYFQAMRVGYHSIWFNRWRIPNGIDYIFLRSTMGKQVPSSLLRQRSSGTVFEKTCLFRELRFDIVLQYFSYGKSIGYTVQLHKYTSNIIDAPPDCSDSFYFCPICCGIPYTERYAATMYIAARYVVKAFRNDLPPSSV